MSLIVKSIVNVPERQTILIILSEYITLLLRLQVRVLKLVPQAVLLVVLGLRELEARVTIFKLGLRYQSPLLQLVALVLQLSPDCFGVETSIEVHSQLHEDLIEGMVFFLHFLVMATALLCLPGLYEICHAFEYFICPPKVLVYEVLVVQLEKPVVELVLFWSPMPFLDVFGLLLSHFYFGVQISLLRLLFVFLSGKTDMALFAEE